ncbi:MAG: HEAT repeat domain-containing protein [Myxococcales bacterium]|nr:HEAT repeat domain-containing protein [Myxococcales bacterium]
MRRWHVMASAGLLGLLAAVGWYLSARSPVPVEASAARVATSPAVEAPSKAAVRYRFRWETTTRAPQAMSGAGPSVLEGRTMLAGLLSLGATAGDPRTLELQLPRLEGVEVQLLSGAKRDNAPLLKAALEGRRAWLSLDEHGSLTGVTTEVGAAPLFANLALALAGELQHEHRPAPEWTSREHTARGLAEVHYQWVTEGPGPGRLLRKDRVRYLELVGLGAATSLSALDGHAELRFDERGVLRQLSVRETLEAVGAAAEPTRSTVRLTLEWDGEQPGVVAARPAVVEAGRLPGQVIQPHDAAAQHLAQRVAGLTPAQLTEGIDRFVAMGSLPDQPLFVIRATGLLQQQPALAAPLGLRAGATASSSERAFVLDLLAGAGTPEAQAALRAAVVSASAVADRERVTQFARLAFIENPTPETVAFVDDAFTTATGKERLDRALVLGAVANALQTHGEPERALQLGTKLVQGLEAAATTKETTAYLRALGNAGLEVQVPRVVARLSHPEPMVRSVAAYALRKTRVPAARQVLLGAVGDSSAEVQRNALHALDRLDRSEAVAVAAQVNRGAVAPRAANDVVTALSPFAGDAAVGAALRRLADAPGSEAQLRERVRTLIEEAQP